MTTAWLVIGALIAALSVVAALVYALLVLADDPNWHKDGKR